MTEQQNTARHGWAHRKALLSQTSTLYNRVELKNITQCTIHGTLRWMSYISRKQYQVPLQSAKDKNPRLHWAQIHWWGVGVFAWSTWLADRIIAGMSTCTNIPLKWLVKGWLSLAKSGSVALLLVISWMISLMMYSCASRRYLWCKAELMMIAPGKFSTVSVFMIISFI